MNISAINQAIEKARRMYIWHLETSSVRRKTELFKNIIWTKERQKEFDDYWITYYGKRIPNAWHKLYQSINGIYNVEYFPEGLFTSVFEPNMNQIEYCRVLRDKSLLPTLYGRVKEIKLPKTYVLFSGGFCYNSNQKVISDKEARSLAGEVGEAVIKPTVMHGSGRNIIIVDFHNGIDQLSGKNVNEIVNRYGKDFCIQERIHPHQSFAAIYPKSINTIKILTYILNGKLYHDPISLRFGSGGSWLDNIHAGGFCIGVNEEGELKRFAYRLGYGDSNERTEIHPDTGFIFQDGRIFGVDKIITAAFQLHGMTPHIGAIAWDFTVNEEGEPVLIEANFNGNSAWFPQVVNGAPLFGKNTIKVLQFLKACKNKKI